MKIFIAGCGIVSAVGKNIRESIESFRSNSIVPSKTTVFETDLSYPVFEVPNFENVVSEQRTYTLLKHAFNEALVNAELSINEILKYRVGVCFGTTVACQLNDLGFYANFKKTKEVAMPSVKRYLQGNLASLIKEKYNFTGPAITVVNACTSGTDAIGTAALWIQNGLCDIAIAGGADELNKIPLSGFASLNNMSEEACCPFDKNRQGLNIGEGAGVVVLVSDKIIGNKKFKRNAEFSAYSTATDGYHLTAPSPEGVGLTKAIQNALKSAHLESKNIGFINAHGTSTKDNDLVEGKVFNKIFGNSIKFTSTKGFTGHTLGAAGAIEAIFTILGLQNNWIPKTAGFKTLDVEIGLAPVSEQTEINEEYGMSTSLAFGGNNSVLIFKRN
jgi:3-oxoacyl-[acyl-carrier-protein] synthase II